MVSSIFLGVDALNHSVESVPMTHVSIDTMTTQSVDFWGLPVGLLVDASDDRVSELEALAETIAPGRWSNQMHSDGIHFRFAVLDECCTFLCACCFCSTPRRISEPARFPDLPQFL
jgi:hypothetical protein